MLYIGMLFFSLAIASGLWSFASVGLDVDPNARLIFYASLFAASAAFAACLLRTGARTGEAQGERGIRQTEVESNAASGTLGAAGEQVASAANLNEVQRSAWRSVSDVDEGWGGAGAAGSPEPARRANGSIG
jgi:hypothetical protein